MFVNAMFQGMVAHLDFNDAYIFLRIVIEATAETWWAVVARQRSVTCIFSYWSVWQFLYGAHCGNFVLVHCELSVKWDGSYNFQIRRSTNHENKTVDTNEQKFNNKRRGIENSIYINKQTCAQRERTRAHTHAHNNKDIILRGGAPWKTR